MLFQPIPHCADCGMGGWCLFFRGREGANLSDVSTTTMVTATTKKRRSRAKAMQPDRHHQEATIQGQGDAAEPSDPTPTTASIPPGVQGP